MSTPNHIGALQEFCQKERIPNPIYSFYLSEGNHGAICEVDLHGHKIEGKGVHQRKKNAQQFAADEVLSMISMDINNALSRQYPPNRPICVPELQQQQYRQQSLRNNAPPHINVMPARSSSPYNSQTTTPVDTDDHNRTRDTADDIQSLTQALAASTISHYSDRLPSRMHVSLDPYASRICPNSPFTEFMPGKPYYTFLRCLVSRFYLPISSIQTKVAHVPVDANFYTGEVRVVTPNNESVCVGRAQESTERAAVQRAAFNALTDLLDFDT